MKWCDTSSGELIPQCLIALKGKRQVDLVE